MPRGEGSVAGRNLGLPFCINSTRVRGGSGPGEETGNPIMAAFVAPGSDTSTKVTKVDVFLIGGGLYSVTRCGKLQ